MCLLLQVLEPRRAQAHRPRPPPVAQLLALPPGDAHPDPNWRGAQRRGHRLRLQVLAAGPGGAGQRRRYLFILIVVVVMIIIIHIVIVMIGIVIIGIAIIGIIYYY